MESAGEILVIFKLPHRIEVFKIGDDMAVQLAQSIGRRALFVGNSRCLSVDSDKFAAVDANSIYYIEYMSYDVRVYSLSKSATARSCAPVEQLVPRHFSPQMTPLLLVSFSFSAATPTRASSRRLGWSRCLPALFLC